MRTATFSGIDAIDAVTEVLRRVYETHPVGGLFHAADVQFWWARERSTDALEQLFWIDDDGQPAAAAMVVDLGGGTSLVYDEVTFCPFVLGDASDDHTLEVLHAGLAHAAELGFEFVESEVAHDDAVTRKALLARGFEVTVPEALVECWVDADARAEISPLADGYELRSRTQTAGRPHHMNREADDAIDRRLNQLSLYDPDLDLVVFASDGTPAGNAIFWFDPVTRTGVVEPVRTHDDHQRRGIARHLLTTGLDLLARAGAERISIGYEPDNPASGDAYRGVGFEPVTGSALFRGPTG